MKTNELTPDKLPAPVFIVLIAGLLPLLALGLRQLGFKRCFAAVNRLTVKCISSPSPSFSALLYARQIAAKVVAVNRRYSFYQAPCLAESLAIYALLRRCGIAARICLGVRTITGVFQSHAWVVFGDEVLNDSARVNQIYESFDLSQLESKAR
jgi:hypothetical protein